MAAKRDIQCPVAVTAACRHSPSIDGVYDALLLLAMTVAERREA